MPSPSSPTHPSGPRTGTIVLTLSEDGYKNLDVCRDDGKALYTVRTAKKGGAFGSSSTSTTISRTHSSRPNDQVALLEWGKKTAETIISYKGKSSELKDVLPPKEWHSRKVLTLSGTWKWSIAGEEPPELFDAERRCVVRYRRNWRLFKKSLPNTLEIDQSAIDCLGLDMIVVGWVVMMRDAEKQPPVYD